MRHVSVRDEKMAAAKARLERATLALHQALGSGSEKEKRAARREHKAAADEWERACAHPMEHYCGPCGKTHRMETGRLGDAAASRIETRGCGILVLKRAIAPGGEVFERSHDLHIVLCEREWTRLGIEKMIA